VHALDCLHARLTGGADEYALSKAAAERHTADQAVLGCGREGRLVVQTCPLCDDRRLPRSPVCSKCLSPDQTWRQCTGQGVLGSWVDFHRAYWDGYHDSLPYRVCLERLVEGPLLISLGESHDARLGALVHVVFDQVTDAAEIRDGLR
jgi:uncharacterized OB-fold protein